MRAHLVVARSVVALAILVSGSSAFAQGNGNGNAYGHYKNVRPSGPSAAGSNAAAAGEQLPAGTGVRNFGSWLDDASMMSEGMGFVSIGFGFFKSPVYREFDMPVMDSAVALHKRVQFGASVPYYHVGEPGGPTTRGLGDLYLSSKIQLREPTEKQLGFSVTPVLELLSAAPEPGESRMAWGIPVNIELRRSKWRTFASAGYFSRGSLFASGAFEAQVSDSVWAIGSISRSHSIDSDPLSVALGLSQTRTDVTGGGTVQVTPRVSVFGAVGRTISRRDANSAVVMVSGGMSYSFTVR